MIETRKCTICRIAYSPVKPWQKYDREECRREAFKRRFKAKIRREILSEMKRGA